ncbi:hypothetical protein CTA2_2863 [Colletotrichum tanaceti]|uniref:PD-(D/E)XK nuclease-like domain-containing protein n=1 Tax=Colletotrichum tanaceti TaxID=1306861 RepID=A0A4U6X1M9_9PEZI|nr:hypothetical protein CTA2_2863 [Colletotrichum tanaceti]TKW49282.1 hypothetical protein CTA1_547 [Colletotrichum tanaceti]
MTRCAGQVSTEKLKACFRSPPARPHHLQFQQQGQLPSPGRLWLPGHHHPPPSADQIIVWSMLPCIIIAASITHVIPEHRPLMRIAPADKPEMPDPCVIDWLHSLPEYPKAPRETVHDHHPSGTPPRKRRRFHPPTPETSKSGCDETAAYEPRTAMETHPDPDKRPAPPGNEETPRPNKKTQTPRSESSYSLTSASTTRSGRQSPQKHLISLERSNHGIRLRDIGSLQDPPAGLVKFLTTIRRISRGHGIIPPSAREELGKQPHYQFAEIFDDDSYFAEQREQLGHVPSPEDVVGILAAATECQENLHDESSWNMCVHHEVLRLAFRPPGKPPFKHLVNFMPCTTATVIKEYLPLQSVSKKVDFCVFVDPTDPHDRSVCLAASGRLPYEVINHTRYFALRQRPVALSIETKKTGEGWDAAALQLGVWQAAHWELLRRLVDISGGDDASALLQQKFEFLPAVIIQGHDWNLVVTTIRGGQTHLWSKIAIGTTNSIMGIYQIVHTLQVLRRWAAETYWPAFRELLLPWQNDAVL